MGSHVGIYSYDKVQLLASILSYYQITSPKDVKDITELLRISGSFVGDRYIIVNNDFWEEYNCYHLLPHILNTMYGTEEKDDIFSNSFSYPKDVDWKEICYPMDIYELYEVYGKGFYPEGETYGND